MEYSISIFSNWDIEFLSSFKFEIIEYILFLSFANSFFVCMASFTKTLFIQHSQFGSYLWDSNFFNLSIFKDVCNFSLSKECSKSFILDNIILYFSYPSIIFLSFNSFKLVSSFFSSNSNLLAWVFIFKISSLITFPFIIKSSFSLFNISIDFFGLYVTLIIFLFSFSIKFVNEFKFSINIDFFCSNDLICSEK